MARTVPGEGRKAPDFTLLDDAGETVKLSDLRGKHVVLYFYPKDDTPGCTREACAFRDGKAKLTRRGAVVLGVSPDSVESHARFKEKHRLNFRLLSDPDTKVATRYGAYGEKVLYGKKRMGVFRSTFLIDADGVVRRAWPNVRVDGHDEQVLQALAELG